VSWPDRFLRGSLDALGLAAGPDEFHRNIRRIALARLISQTGSVAAKIALLALVYERTNGSGLWLAAVLFSSFVVAQVTLGPLMGAAGDYFDRRVVMILSDLGAAAAFVCLAFAHQPIMLLLLSICAAIAEAPFTPAANAQLLMMVPEDRQTWATSIRSTAQWTGILLGGICGGTLVALVGAPTTFLINAATFVASAFLAIRLSGGPYRAEHSTSPEHRGLWAGVRYAWSRPAIRFSIATVALALLGGGMMKVAEYPLFVHLGDGSFAYGISIVAWGIGGIFGGRNARRQRDAHQERRVFIWAQVLLAFGLIACGLVPISAVVIALFSATAFGWASVVVTSNLIQQRWTPDPIRARVFGAVSSITAAALGISLAIGGVALSTLGAAGVLTLGGVITLAGVLTAIQVPPRKRPMNIDPTPKPLATEDERTSWTLGPLPNPA
jgi:MFS family permease